MAVSDKRIFKRFSVPISVRYTLPDGSSSDALIDNISMEGISFSLLTNENIPEGTKLKLTIRMPKYNRRTVITGEVVWQKKSKLREGGYDIGIKFIQSDPWDIENIIASLRNGQYFVQK